MAVQTRGDCYLCGESVAKSTFLKHLATHQKDEADSTQECIILKVVSTEDKNYWLYLDISSTASLKTLDSFLRKIWLECCDHMSVFTDKYGEVGKARKLAEFPEGSSLLYVYDMGSSTELKITIVSHGTRPKQRASVRLLARNARIQHPCAQCGKVAKQICLICQSEGHDPFLCQDCADEHAHGEALLPVTNSPRMGVCAYTGEQDTFTFTPPTKKATPRASKKKVVPNKLDLKDSILWTALYGVANTLRDLQPWKYLHYGDVVAILPGGAEEPFYCTVLGRTPENFGVAVYEGKKGLSDLRRLLALGESGESSRYVKADQTRLVLQWGANVSEEQRALFKDLDLKFRGRADWPAILDEKSRFVPALPDDRGVRVLTETVKNLFVVTHALQDKELGQGGWQDGCYLLRKYDIESETWNTGWMPADKFVEDEPQVELEDEEMLASLQGAPESGAHVLMDLIYMPTVIENETDRAYLPVFLCAMDKETGEVLQGDLLTPDRDEIGSTLACFANCVLNHGRMKTLQVRNTQMAKALSSLCAACGITLVQQGNMPEMDALAQVLAGELGH